MVRGRQKNKPCGVAHLITQVLLVTWVGCSQLECVGMLREQETKYEVLKTLKYSLSLSRTLFLGLDFLYFPDQFGAKMFE